MRKGPQVHNQQDTHRRIPTHAPSPTTMPSDLSSYLATHYLTADPKPSKKRKRKQAATDGLIIADDDETGWSRRGGGDDEDDEENAMNVAVAGTSAEFRKAKKSGWKVLGGGLAKTPQPPADDTSRAADAILASAAAESAAAAAADDGEDAPVMMSDGTYAGLQTGATVSAQLARRRAAERAEYERSGGAQQKEAETIYRDATGRRVDVSMKRAELRREAEEAARKRAEAEQALRGDVQIDEARRRREALDDAKVMGVARHADDADMNADMKAQVRWGDTMAAFVKPKDDAGKGPGRRVKGRPVYKGAWAPNRYQIPPGYRWDGVDRSNGFEAERFKAINRRERNKDLDYSWQMDE
ncbi:Pre-mRNA-splicing factor of RES complex-domain-containing protein [Xylaria telfairii]|nr:Pre-mRNA-splicing factor of RES complex-domain-containing protein [Xylaria telfairii]